jgi:hypothetical protein
LVSGYAGTSELLTILDEKTDKSTLQGSRKLQQYTTREQNDMGRKATIVLVSSCSAHYFLERYHSLFYGDRYRKHLCELHNGRYA